MIEVGEIYEDKETKTWYEVLCIHFHWKTRGRVVHFMSTLTASQYVLEVEEFLTMSKKVMDA